MCLLYFIERNTIVGMDLREYLPAADKMLDASELGDLRHQANFQYLIKAGYEQVQRILT